MIPPLLSHQSADAPAELAPEAGLHSQAGWPDMQCAAAADLPDSSAADVWELEASVRQTSAMNVARCTAAVDSMVAAWAAQQRPPQHARSARSGAAAAAHESALQPGAASLPAALSATTAVQAAPSAAQEALQRRLQRPDGEVSSIVLVTRLRLAQPRPSRRIIPGTRA